MKSLSVCFTHPFYINAFFDIFFLLLDSNDLKCTFIAGTLRAKSTNQKICSLRNNHSLEGLPHVLQTVIYKLYSPSFVPYQIKPRNVTLIVSDVFGENCYQKQPIFVSFFGKPTSLFLWQNFPFLFRDSTKNLLTGILWCSKVRPTVLLQYIKTTGCA